VGITEKNARSKDGERTRRSRRGGSASPRDFRAVRSVRGVVNAVAASSAMICIEERGGKPEQAGPVQPRPRVDPVPAGSFALRFRFDAPLARIDRVRGISGRLDVAVVQVATAYADLERNNRIYFTQLRRSSLSD